MSSLYDKVKNTDKLRKRKYGITREQYEKMLREQEGLCAGCHQPETVTRGGVVRELVVDHNHETGAVRGLLCSKCNIMLGLCKDQTVVLLRLADYLVDHHV